MKYEDASLEGLSQFAILKSSMKERCPRIWIEEVVVGGLVGIGFCRPLDSGHPLPGLESLEVEAQSEMFGATQKRHT